MITSFRACFQIQTLPLNLLDFLNRHNALIDGKTGLWIKADEQPLFLLVDTAIEGASPSRARQEQLYLGSAHREQHMVISSFCEICGPSQTSRTWLDWESTISRVLNLSLFRIRTYTNPKGTEANQAGETVRACVARESKHKESRGVGVGWRAMRPMGKRGVGKC
jgi:hypothetical protein